MLEFAFSIILKKKVRAARELPVPFFFAHTYFYFIVLDTLHNSSAFPKA